MRAERLNQNSKVLDFKTKTKMLKHSELNGSLKLNVFILCEPTLQVTPHYMNSFDPGLRRGNYNTWLKVQYVRNSHLS